MIVTKSFNFPKFSLLSFYFALVDSNLNFYFQLSIFGFSLLFHATDLITVPQLRPEMDAVSVCMITTSDDVHVSMGTGAWLTA